MSVKDKIGKKKIATVEDLKEVAYFNRIVKNYMKMLRLRRSKGIG